MTTNLISAYLQYANLQMAAEALYGVDPNNSWNIGAFASPGMTTAALTAGNDRTNKFPAPLADQLGAQGWTVVAHQPNTGTGFSGTLFKNANTGEYVLSFRSTEFIDDAVRDNQATNKMEIKDHGWAFGQIADMEDWYASLKASGKLPSGVKPTVTGYSLGGHLATAFNLLHPTDSTATYTFNGAGVGDLTGAKTLAQVVADFDRMRKNADRQQIRATLPSRSFMMTSRRGSIAVDVPPMRGLTLVQGSAGALTDKTILLQALQNLQAIWNEVDRVAGITDSVKSPIPVSTGNIST